MEKAIIKYRGDWQCEAVHLHPEHDNVEFRCVLDKDHPGLHIDNNGTVFEALKEHPGWKTKEFYKFVKWISRTVK